MARSVFSIHRPSDRRRSSATRKGLLSLPRRNAILIALLFFCCIGVYMLISLQNQLPELDKSNGAREEEEVRSAARRRPEAGTALRFRPLDLLRRMQERTVQMNRVRSEKQKGIRPPRLALVTLLRLIVALVMMNVAWSFSSNHH